MGDRLVVLRWKLVVSELRAVFLKICGGVLIFAV